MKKLEEYVVSIPDYPEKGIIFRDVTSILEDPEGLQLSIRELQDKLEGMDFNIVIGPESRGFIFGMPIAYNLQKAFVPIRKKGKLPLETIEESYDLEYGSATIEMHKDSIKPGQKVVIIDDTPDGGKIHIFWRKNGKKAEFSVQNTCDTLPEGDLNRLFDRFYRADASRARESGGYGIGLSVAAALVKAHKGKITAERTQDGICFKAVFPAKG